MTEADILRARWARAQPILDELDARAATARQATPVGTRLAEGVAHSDELLRLFPPPPESQDDEAETWARMRRRLLGEA